MAVLTVQSLSKRFGKTAVLHDVSLELAAGQVYGLVGPNGSGKTTTISCILGLQRPTTGRIELLGQPVAKLHRTAGRVAAVFDSSPFVSGLSVRANMAYAARLRGHAGGTTIDAALERVGMLAFAERRFSKLSLGQGKRVAIASALAGSPEFMVLDEPLSGLDTLGVRSMLKLVRELTRDGLTMLICSHRLHAMESVVTHAGILLDGRLVRDGALAELIESDDPSYELVVSDEVRARAALTELTGLTLEFPTDGSAQPEAKHVNMIVHTGATPIEAVNRKLVEAGCEVSAIKPRKLDLQQVFERAVEEFEVQEVA